MTPRLTSEVWVAAYLTRLRLADIPAFIVQRGDHTAGAVLVKLNTLDGQAKCFQRSFDLMTGEQLGDAYRDINPECTLEVGWQLYGEDYNRGAFLVRMRAWMRSVGVEERGELPADLAADDAEVVGRHLARPRVMRAEVG